MLEESDQQLRPTGAAFAKALPVDAESRFPLIERVNLKTLSEAPGCARPGPMGHRQRVSEHREELRAGRCGGPHHVAEFLNVRPAGNGKESPRALHRAGVGPGLYVARLDGLISSFLGSTSKNIRALFDFAAKTPCVLFLDEFDAIAKLRGDSQELGELKRVVNSFIQNLDTLGNQSIVIAATNHQELLDSAIWRRFSYRLAWIFPLWGFAPEDVGGVQCGVGVHGAGK